VLVGGGELLLRAHYLMTEVHLKKTIYEGVRNDFCLDHLPYFVNFGFEFVMMLAHKITLRGLPAAQAYCPRPTPALRDERWDGG